MPIYEYECPACGKFEVMQKITADPLEKCETCGKPVRKLMSTTSFALKGSGWYATDYASGKKNDAGPAKRSDSEAKAGGSSTSESKAEGGGEKKADAAGGEKKADSGGSEKKAEGGGEKKAAPASSGSGSGPGGS